jgi:hypothetical protein
MTARSAVDREVGQGRRPLGGAGQGVPAGAVKTGVAEEVCDQHDVAAGPARGLLCCCRPPAPAHFAPGVAFGRTGPGWPSRLWAEGGGSAMGPGSSRDAWTSTCGLTGGGVSAAWISWSPTGACWGLCPAPAHYPGVVRLRWPRPPGHARRSPGRPWLMSRRRRPGPLASPRATAPLGRQ